MYDTKPKISGHSAIVLITWMEDLDQKWTEERPKFKRHYEGGTYLPDTTTAEHRIICQIRHMYVPSSCPQVLFAYNGMWHGRASSQGIVTSDRPGGQELSQGVRW